MRRVLGFLILVSSLAATNFAYGVQDQKAFFAADQQTDGQDRIFSTLDDSGTFMSQLGHWPNMICTSTKDPVCDFKNAKTDSENSIRATPVLGPCEFYGPDDCVESVEIASNNGDFRKLKFVRTMPGVPNSQDGKEFSGDAAMNLPQGTSPSIWRDGLDDLEYYVSFTYEMQYIFETKKFEIGKVRLSIKPFKQINESAWSSIWYETSTSGILYNFRDGDRFRVTTHINKKASGWFMGRVNLPEISIKQFDATNNLLIVTASPVKVPTFSFKRRADSLSEEESQFWEMQKGVVFVGSSDPEIFKFIELARKTVDDKASNFNTYWGIKTANAGNEVKCLSDKNRVLGIVSTNSMGYEGTPPSFRNGFLNYRVTGLHFGPDGGLNKGTYDLVVRSDVARCLYGFSKAPVSATVSVSGTDGVQDIATAVLNEKDGWMYLRAAGFTFSSKNIRIKLLQKKITKKK